MTEVLNSAEDFEWYKKGLDVSGRYAHQHNGRPDRYPCKVISEFWDDPNGPYNYNHSFVYQQEVECPQCHHKTLVWPDQAE